MFFPSTSLHLPLRLLLRLPLRLPLRLLFWFAILTIGGVVGLWYGGPGAWTSSRVQLGALPASIHGPVPVEMLSAPLPFLCFATHDNGATLFQSTDAQAVRDAIATAASGGTVKIAGSCTGVVTQSDEIQVARVDLPLTLEGGYVPGNWSNSDPVVNPTILDAQGNGRVLYISTAVTLTNLKIRNGYAENFGGGVLVTGASAGGGVLTVLNSEFSDNNAGQFGGAIEVYGISANIQNSSFLNNRAGFNGGAIDSIRVLTITNSSFLGNAAGHRGGAIYNYLGYAVLNNITVSNNTSAGYGGGIGNDDGSLLLMNSILKNNTANDRGGGLNLYLSVDNKIGVTNTIFARNLANNGIGHALAMGYTGTVTIAHVTISGDANSAPAGAALDASDNLNIKILNTIIAHYQIGIRKNAGALTVYEDYNDLYHLPTAAHVGSVTHGGHSVRGNPLFMDEANDNYDLASNASAAVDAGTDLNVPHDILRRLRPQGKGPDIGAFEREQPTTPTVTPTPTATATPTPTNTDTATPTPTSSDTATPTSTSTDAATATSTPTIPPASGTQESYLPLIIGPLPTPTRTPTPKPEWQRIGAGGLTVSALAIQTDQLFAADRRDFEQSGGLYKRSIAACESTLPLSLVRIETIVAPGYSVIFQGAQGVLATHKRDIFYTQDGGSTWTQTATPVRDSRTVAGAGANLFYAGSNTAGIYRSADGGVTWEQRKTNPAKVSVLRLDTLDSDILWVGTEDTGVWVLSIALDRLTLRDNGLTTANSKKVWDFDFDSAGNIYVASYDGIFKWDGVSSWQPFGLQGAVQARSLAVVGDQLYTGAQFVQNQSTVAGVWRRPLNGGDWAQVTSVGWNPNYTVRDLLYDPTFCKGLLAATEDGVWVYK